MIRNTTIFTLLAIAFATLTSYAEVPVSSDDSVSAPAFNLLDIPFSVQPAAAIPVNEQEIRAGLLYDAVNKTIVWQKHVNNAYPIASLTKMMVAFLTAEDVRSGKYDWNDEVTWQRVYYVGKRSKRQKVTKQAKYTLRDLFKASMIASNNECAEQMARYIGGGDLKSTIDRMNERAKELGMTQTYYGNPTGLPASRVTLDNSSTPSDLLLLTLEMLKFQEVMDIAAMGYAEIENRGKANVIRNHNRLTIDYSGEVDGLKTGYTRRAGFCLVATTEKCSHRLVSIVLGCRGPEIRNQMVRDMINDYYASIGLEKLGPNDNSDGQDNLAKQTVNGKYVTIYEPHNKVHYVKRGESLSTIAAKYGCTMSQLRSWNRMRAGSSRIYAGGKLIVKVGKPKSVFIADPVNGSESDDDKQLITDEEKRDIDLEASVNENSKNSSGTAMKEEDYLYHIIAPGDTLFSIAKRYIGVSVDDLKELNQISDIKSLKPGTKIKVMVQG